MFDAFYDARFNTVVARLWPSLTQHFALATQMHTVTNDNLKKHFVDHLRRFIKMTTAKCERDLTEERNVKVSLTHCLKTKKQSCRDWLDTPKLHCLPTSLGTNLPYDVGGQTSPVTGMV